MQVIAGLIPLAQVREPFSAVRWLCSCSQPALPEVLKLRPLKQLDRSLVCLDMDDPRVFEVEDGALPPWCRCRARLRLIGWAGLRSRYAQYTRG